MRLLITTLAFFWASVAAADNWLMAHVDVETTGLKPGYHEMIDIGIVITDPEGVERDRIFLRIMPAHPERIEPGAAAVNGFSVALWKERGYISEAQAVEQIFAFHQRVAGSQQVLFTGFNAWFDISFVDALFSSQGKNWRELYHYFIMDIPSMAWGQGLRGLTGSELAAAAGMEAETSDPLEHTGITGAAFNAALYRKLIKRLDGSPTPP